MEKQNYNIGLDIGTTSVGWAVVNPDNYKIIRKGNKSLWGVRLFEEAITAEARRNYRSTRRRYERRRERIKLLQKEFENEINKVDSKFYTKLKESFYNELDLERKTISLTKEEKQLIKEYNIKYPTIYHLRDKLINNTDKEDIRLIYLAIHHIIKYRGNFLYNGNFNIDNLDIKSKLKDIFENIYTYCEDFNLDIDSLNDNFYSNLEKSITLKSKNDKKVVTKDILDNKCDKNFINEFLKLISGNQFSIVKILNLDSEEDLKLSFKETTYDDKYSEIETLCGDKIIIIDELKNLYDMIFLKQLFESDNKSLSSLMVSKYNKHKEDLKFIKELFKYDEVIYKKMFKDKQIKDKNGDVTKEELCLYKQFVNNKMSYNDFKNILKKEFDKILKLNIKDDLKDKCTIKLEELENDNFLPRITDTDNGKYPYQLNRDELIKIIENQGKYYPFLLDKVNGEYKLVKLLSFKIPYYVGPLSNTTDKSNVKNKNSWLERKVNNVKITPYNFDEVVNKEASAEKFITRMISHCTYILDEYAIPNNSILYLKYKVMNELKQIKVNNEKIPNDLQHQIYEELFLKEESTITEKKFIDYLIKTNEYNMYPTLDVTGYSEDKKFANNMQSYIDFFGINGIFKDTNYNIVDAEEIIRWVTIFEDKDILETKLRDKYDKLSDNVIKKILLKKYKGWSNLSEKLLTDIFYKDKTTGINKSIMDLMYETNENFMQILNNKEYKFQKEIDKLNKIDNNTKINYSLVENLATSPSTKRGIYQALKVVDEIVDYMGYNPDNIMIEMARSDDKNKSRKDNKKDYIDKLYVKFKDEIKDYKRLKKELESIDRIDNDKLFLYFIQEGKSLYSGIPLDINNLEDYEIDHIIPRTLTKDNSIDNKALVLRKENQEKAASFVLPKEYIRGNLGWWQHLSKCNLISNKKLNNLKRTYYSDKDIEGFINRQLVETRQITKHVANILNNIYENTNVVYLHADLTSNYRDKYELFKYRDLNDYHHAHDAYLAAVLGEYKEKYLNISTDFNKLKILSKRLYEEKRYDELKYGYVINSIDNDMGTFDEKTGEILFDACLFNKTIEDTLYRNDILISKKTEIKTGEFYDETIYKKNSIKAKYSLKNDLSTNLYGGYNSYKYSYMKLIEYRKNNKIENMLIGIPILLVNNKNKESLINDYITKNLNCDNYKVIIEKIPFNIEVIYKEQLCSITGCGIGTSEIINATEFKLDRKSQEKYKYLLNYIFNNKYPKNKNSSLNNQEFISYYNNQFNILINDLFKDILDKMHKYYPLYDSFYQKLLLVLDSKEFEELPLNISAKEEKNKMISKVIVIKEIFKLLKYNSSNSNLVNLNKTTKFSDRIGRISGANVNHAIIINKSVTGLRIRKYEFPNSSNI